MRAGRVSRSLMMDAFTCLECCDERDSRVLSMEPYYLKELCCAADSGLDAAIELVEGLIADKERIGANIQLTRGAIFSESVMMNLGTRLGRMRAHELVHQCAMQAAASGTTLQEELQRDSRLKDILEQEELNDLMKPENYVGLSAYFADRVADKTP